MKRKFFLLFFALSSCLQASSLCDYTTDLSLYGGYANIKTDDFVFAPKPSQYAHTVSNLTWTAENVWVLGAIGKVTLPKNQIHILVDGWSKVYAGNGKMVDRDYLNKSDHSQLTDISIHPDTKLKTAFAIDLEIGKGFQLFRKSCSAWSFGYLLGVKYIRYGWESFGGSFNYDNGERVGNFPHGLKVITYSQQFTIPYIGLQASWLCNTQWSFRGFCKYSSLGYALCHDNHLLSDRRFTDVHYCAQYWMLGAEAVWSYSDAISAYLKYSYDHLSLATGHTTVRKRTETQTFANSSGVKATLQMLTLGITTRF